MIFKRKENLDFYTVLAQQAQAIRNTVDALCIQIGNDLPSSMVLSTVNGVTAEKPLWFFLERYMASYQAEIRSFIRSIEQNRQAEIGIADGRMTIRIALACKKSFIEHRPVRIEEL